MGFWRIRWLRSDGTPAFPDDETDETDETEQTQKRPLTRMGAFNSLLRVLILALVTATVFIVVGSFWIGSEDSSENSSSDNSAANLQRQFSQERDRASVAIGGLTAAREPENVALTKQRELKQALDESEARSKALARELAETKQHADARQMELQEALDKSEKRALALERENAAQKQTVDARQTELKQALDKSEARSEALARELASARKNDVAARAAALERENAAQKQTADAKQTELKQALDESEKRALALERELTSARETIASAEKPSNAEVTARDAASPTGSLNRPMERSNAASEITGSMPTPQGRANVTAGVQTSSDATPNDVTAGASGRRPQLPRAMSSAEEAKLIARAESLIKQFDFANARLFLANALEKGSARAAFMMAETYDWQILRSLQA